MADDKKLSTKVITGTVRLSYCHVFEAYTNDPDSAATYSCVLMIPKSDKATMKKLRDAQQAALEYGKEKKFGGRIPKNWKDTIHDGDDEDTLVKNPEYAGHWIMAVSSKQRPGVVDQSVNPIMDSSEVYSGVYARVSLGAFAYNTQGNKGVSFGLNNVQKVRDGEPLGGVSSRAEDDFDELPDEDFADEDGLL